MIFELVAQGYEMPGGIAAQMNGVRPRGGHGVAQPPMVRQHVLAIHRRRDQGDAVIGKKIIFLERRQPGVRPPCPPCWMVASMMNENSFCRR